MEKITLDTNILKIEGIKELFKTKYTGLSINFFIYNEKISTLGDLLMYADYMLVSGDKARKALKDFIHGLGFVFIEEEGFIEQLRGHIAKKYNIYNFNYQALDLATKRKLLSFKISELLVFFPEKISDKASLEAKYSSKTLKEVLDEKNYFMKKSKYSPNFSSSNFNFFWDKFIHELEFVFGDEPGYKKQIAELEQEEPKEDFDFSKLDTPIEDLDYHQFLSNYTYNYIKNLNINTLRELFNYVGICQKLPIICLNQLRNFVHYYDLPFFDEDKFLEFSQNMAAEAEIQKNSDNIFSKTILSQRFKNLSQKLFDLMEQKNKLSIDNANLERINNSLESLIATLDEKNNTLNRNC